MHIFNTHVFFRKNYFPTEPRPVLTVSPSWLSAGASVTLTCSVKDQSAGWRFYWYKTVPKLSRKSYSHELLPGSSNGTKCDYIVHGQTHTVRYLCKARRGDPVYYTDYSRSKFVWSGGQYVSCHVIDSVSNITWGLTNNRLCMFILLEWKK